MPLKPVYYQNIWCDSDINHISDKGRLIYRKEWNLMKTDALFYRLFRIAPRSLFQLVQLNIKGRYTFRSITAKTTEKRFDGFLSRADGAGPNIFLEIQGYPDNKIYWRAFREVCTWYEDAENDTPFVVIVLFIDEKYDPGECQLTCVPPNELIRANLTDCLRKVWDKAGILTILKPFALSDKEELVKAVPQWKADIISLKLPESKINTALELMAYAALQRFPGLTIKEIDKMLELTPLEKTVAGQELIWMGELIGEIRMAQRILKRPVSSKDELAQKNTEELKEMFQQIEAELRAHRWF